MVMFMGGLFDMGVSWRVNGRVVDIGAEKPGDEETRGSDRDLKSPLR